MKRTHPKSTLISKFNKICLKKEENVKNTIKEIENSQQTQILNCLSKKFLEFWI